jgi:hypothetical protein
LPLVYALLPDKKQETYVKFFRMLSEYIMKEPTYISSDFELAVLNSIKIVFPDAKINGCYFHLVQNFWKHVKSEKLESEYAGNNNFRQAFKQLQALSFVPETDTVCAFNYLKSIACHEFRPILTYFEENYIGSLIPGTKSFQFNI